MTIDFKIGDYVYFYDNYQNIFEGRIINIIKRKDKTMCAIKLKSGGLYGAEMSHCFATLKELYQGIKNAYQKQLKAYCDQIQTINDLVSFGYEHCVAHAEEYTNHPAREAYQKRAKELLGLDL